MFKSQNQKLAFILFGCILLMVGLSYASVPLYDLFCRVTGFGGTTQRQDIAEISDDSPEIITDRMVNVRFDTNIDPNLNWDFRPPNEQVEIALGEGAVVNFKARNLSPQTLHGTATFNITPQKAGMYFVKTQCFCFDSQELAPGQQVDMPVMFYVDPAITKDKNMDDVKVITLSYTFFANNDG